MKLARTVKTLVPNNSCCFDFGNVETNNRDNGERTYGCASASNVSAMSSLHWRRAPAQVGLDNGKRHIRYFVQEPSEPYL